MNVRPDPTLVEPVVNRSLISLDVNDPVWPHVFTVAPLVVVGSIYPDGSFDLAPKHMVTPLGWGNYFGFVCTPMHRTYHNVRREGAFTVTYVRPSQVVLASLTANRRARCEARLSGLAHVPGRNCRGRFPR